MNKKQLNYTLDKLKFKGARRDAMKMIIIDKMTSYCVEEVTGLPKNTGSRDAKKVLAKWKEICTDAAFVLENSTFGAKDLL